jgi:hypothetical protein
MFGTFIYDKGGYAEKRERGEEPRPVPFPVCLAIKYGDDVPEACPDFILDIDRSRVFVITDTPLPEGTSVVLHLYIPPEIKLLTEIQGTVVTVNRSDAHHPKGMLIKFVHISAETAEVLKRYIEGEKHLIDKKA